MKWKLVKAKYKTRDLDRFVKGMKQILHEKSEKYEDTWKTCNLGTLKNKQLDQANSLIIKRDELEKAIRTLYHIAIYSFLLIKRLNELINLKKVMQKL